MEERPTNSVNYLSPSSKTPKEQKYNAILWDAFEINYTHSKRQFAFLAGLSNMDIVQRRKDLIMEYRGEKS